MTRVLVTGGRDFRNALAMGEVLAGVHRAWGISCLIHAASLHADTIADVWARGWGIPVLAFPIDHALDGPPLDADTRRTMRMLRDGKPDRVVALPGGRGTWAVVGHAAAAGVPVWYVHALPGAQLRVTEP